MPFQSRGDDETATVDQGGNAEAGGPRRRFGWRRRPAAAPASTGSGSSSGSTSPGRTSSGSGGTGGGPAGGRQPADATRQMPAVDVEDGTTPLAPPGYTLYRPSGIDSTRRLEDDER
jgi:hypothetical protein